MKHWIKRGATVVGGLAGATLAVAAIANARWARATARTAGRLAVQAPPGDRAATFSPHELAGLPDPVVRYFTFALTPGQQIIRRARVEQQGEFQMRPGGGWKPFTAVQHFAVEPPGFVWDAAIRLAPLLAVRVRDSYLEGEGTMHGALAALVSVVDQRGTPEMAASSLHRYLQEAVWLPTALLPSAGVVWTAVDNSTARATLTDRGTSVSVDFHFGPQGEIVRTSVERYRDVNGRGVLTPQVGRLREYERVEGMMVPRAGEVEWLLPEGPFPFWRGRIIDFRYEFAS